MGIDEIKAVFLDRDGVINDAVVIDGKPYPPNTVQDVIILPGVKEGITDLKNNGYKIIVVTNQPDVARGKTPLETVNEINNYLKGELDIDQIYCCYHDDVENCDCRKPKPGMLLKASKEWQINLKSSFMIGDRWKDIDAAKAAGVRAILINYDYNEKFSNPDFKCVNFAEAVNYILRNKQTL